MNESKKNVAIFMETTYERPFKLIEGILSVKGIRDRCTFRNFMLYAANKEDIFTPEWSPDGIITSYGETEAGLEWLSEIDVPVVNLAHTASKKHASVGNDYESQANGVIEHFMALEVASLLFTGSCNMESSSILGSSLEQRCLEGGLPYASIDVPDQLTAAEIPRLDEIVPGIRKLIDSMPKPLAIFTFHDQRGRVLVDYVQRIGYSVPNEVSLLGAFDSIDARLCDPPLSSVILRDHEIGARGIELLGEMMTNPEFPKYNLYLPINGVRMRASTAANNEVDMEVLIARQMIRDRACGGVTVDQIVAELKVSRSTFEKRFSALTGHSPAQEIREVRLEKARGFLLTTDLPLSKVAPLVGFMDRRAFMVFFKRESGMTPGAFREAHK